MQLVNIIGNTYERLIVKKYLGGSQWQCKCICGNIVKVSGTNLKTGNSKSCGCLERELLIKRNTTHGMTGTPIFHAYNNMMARCYNPNNDRYADWGGRGIRVCKRWRKGEDGKSGFECFYKDMGEKPNNKSIHRKNNDKNYSSNNCIWATTRIQSRDTRRNILIQVKGKQMVLKDACLKLGLNYNTIQARVKDYGMSYEAAIKLGHKRKPYTKKHSKWK